MHMLSLFTHKTNLLIASLMFALSVACDNEKELIQSVRQTSLEIKFRDLEEFESPEIVRNGIPRNLQAHLLSREFGLQDATSRVRKWICKDTTLGKVIFDGSGYPFYLQNGTKAGRQEITGFLDNYESSLSFEVSPVEFVKIPGDTFTMGTEEAIAERLEETPAHKVAVSAFDIGKYEVTNREYKAYLEQAIKLGKVMFDNVNGDGFYSKPENKLYLRLQDSRFVSLVSNKDSVLVQSGHEDHPVTGVTWYGAGGQNIIVPKNGVRNLNPGSYGNVTVGSSAKLNLTSGEYRFVKLETQNKSFLNFDVSNGGVQVKVTKDLKFDDEVRVTITPGGEVNSNSVDFITLQTSKVLLDKACYVLGTIIAPNAEVATEKDVRFRGAIMAKKITVEKDVIFLHHTSPGALPLPKPAADEGEDSEQSPVISYQLEQNYPNPFNPSTTIRFALPEAGDVSLKIYNLQGQLVREVVNGHLESGRHNAVWDGRNAAGQQVASGLYWYRLRAGSFVQTRKMVLVR